MKIKAIKFDEAVKRIEFIKNINKTQAKKFLTDRGATKHDDLFVVIDAEWQVGIKIHTYGEPKEIEINFVG